MSNLIGALVGAAIDRQDGDSGIKGALVGVAAQGALRIAIPVAITYGIGWLVQYGVRKAWRGMAGADPATATGDGRT